MPYTLTRHDRVFLVRWSDLSLPDLTRVKLSAQRAHLELGAKLLYVTVVEDGARVPNGDERKALLEFSRELTPIMEKVYMIFEGHGLRQSIQRAAITGVLLFVQRKGLPITVHRSVEEIFPDLSQRLGDPVARLEEALREQGLNDRV
jgi:hypothetical protein